MIFKDRARNEECLRNVAHLVGRWGPSSAERTGKVLGDRGCEKVKAS